MFGQEKSMINETNVIQKYERITKHLIKEKLTISTMESCTAGMVANFLTDTEGSSAIMKGAYITYSNEAKIKQGVPADIIEKNGVYSRETALSMAKACMDSYGADIGLGVTGTLGNTDPENADSVPGEVHLGIIFSDISRTFSFTLPSAPSRHEYKLIVSDLIADELLKILL